MRFRVKLLFVLTMVINDENEMKKNEKIIIFDENED
jgi:hypothetical protein